MNWWEVFGWAGSVLVVLSLMIPSVRRFRILNLTGSLIATIYNTYFEIWPYAVMNGAIVLINIYWLYRLSQRGKTEERGYSVIPANAHDALVSRFISRNRDDIAKHYPNFYTETLEGAHTRLIMHEDEVIGIFGVRQEGEAGSIVIDYVTERFRDFGPGAYVYANGEMFSHMGVSELSVPLAGTTDEVYFAKQGFKASGDRLLRTV